ncbi:NIPSNAP family protein [Vibrio sp. S4M6]|uniref:NIPSNAP family protein n=1 Tax=Vibrio sinus TaxID=2946865 RepID=UPI002029D824|nr:NIPSNAP family protein [Vibrio sinus]MCL9780414.1 NIPSNAP family protein [Vibrio sinus]
MKVIELREYKLKPGKTEQWLCWMEEEILPLQRSKGMKIISTYIHKGDDGADYFIWLREFDDEASRQAISAETYDEAWIRDFRPKVFQHIEQDAVRVRLLNPVQL